jgi:DNA-binding NarL/FixJ family response regulator
MGEPRNRSAKQSRILLVDDHPLVRERLAEVIQREADLAVCAEAEERHQALAAIAATRPDLAVIDLTLKNSHGLELIKDVRARYPQLAMLVVSMHDESLHAERVIRAGARGYITKQEATKKILLAIRTVLDGGIYLSERMTAHLASKAVGRSDIETVPIDQLTDRELFVFELIGHGFGTRQIADELGVDMSTVETYRARIKEKLHLKDANDLRQSAIHWARSIGAI